MALCSVAIKMYMYIELRSEKTCTRSDKKEAVKSRGLLFRLYDIGESYHLYSETKGAEQLHCNCVADLRLYFFA